MKRLAWGLCALWLAITAVTVAVAIGDEDRFGLILAPALAGFAVVGALIASRHQGNAIGWLLLAFAIVFSLANAIEAYVETHAAPAPLWLWLDDWVSDIWIALVGVWIPLLFPDGRLPSGRWRPVAWFGTAAFATGILAKAFGDRMLDTSVPGTVPNPYALPGAAGDLLAALVVPAQVAYAPAALGATVALGARLRHARGVERQQLKWFAYVGALTLFALLLAAMSLADPERLGDTVGTVGWFAFLMLVLVGMPVAIGSVDPALPALRHRRRHQPHAGLRRADGDARRDLHRQCAAARPHPRAVQRRDRGLDARRRRAVPAGAGPDPARGRPALLPPPLRRRTHARRVRRAAARRARPRGAPARARERRGGDGAAGARLAVAAGGRAVKAWLIWGGSLVVVLATMVLLALGAGHSTPSDSFGLSGFGGVAFAIAALAFATVGALVVARVPGNPIGPVFCLTGAILAVGDFVFQYADRALYITPGELPGGNAAAWLQNFGLPPAFGLLGVALLLFPDGRLPSRRWRPALWLALAGIGLNMLGYALRPGPLDEPFAVVINPLGVPGTFGLMDALSGFGWMFMGASVALAAAATPIRLARARGLERAQLKWLALATAITGVAVVSDVISYFVGAEGIGAVRDVVLALGFAVFPLAAGAAILRYRLYDIDVVINRTLVYGALTATLGGDLPRARAAAWAWRSAAPASRSRSRRSRWRRCSARRAARIQAAVDRRFYRRRYDAAQTLEAFGSTPARRGRPRGRAGSSSRRGPRHRAARACLAVARPRNDSRTHGP